MRLPNLHLRGLPSDDLAVDLGTTHVFIHSRTRGLVVNEPAIVAVDTIDRTVVATGNEAYELVGRSPNRVELHYPVREGAIADSELAQAMLSKFVRAARGGRPRFSRRIIFAVPSAATTVERRAVRAAVGRSGGGRVYVVDALVAAALDAVPSDDRGARLVIDLGAGATTAGIVADADLLAMRSVRVGGLDLDKAVADVARRRHNLSIGERTAERVKIEVGSATAPSEIRTTEVRGQSVTHDRPATATISNEEVYEALRFGLRAMARTAQWALGDLRPEVAADVGERGFVLTGGGSLLAGVLEHFEAELGLTGRTADGAREAVARGAARLFDEPLLLRRVDRALRGKE